MSVVELCTESVRALVLCTTHEKHILTLPKPLYAFMLSYSVCPRLRPSAVYPSRIEESFTAFVKAAGERARPPARREKERGRPLSLLSQSACYTSNRGEPAERHRASERLIEGRKYG